MHITVRRGREMVSAVLARGRHRCARSKIEFYNLRAIKVIIDCVVILLKAISCLSYALQVLACTFFHTDSHNLVDQSHLMLCVCG